MTRIFATSDVHIDHPANREWLRNLSKADYKKDILILAGDVSDSLDLLRECFENVASRFYKALYVPGNHDLWVIRSRKTLHSFDKFELIKRLAGEFDVGMTPFHHGNLSIFPLLGWYDYSFGPSSKELRTIWMDYHACRWPDGYDHPMVAQFFMEKNEITEPVRGDFRISFSHFLPRIDVMPFFIPPSKRNIYPVLGSTSLDAQVRKLGSRIHVYGHSHVNRNVTIDGVTYINSAFGYPSETGITSKRLAFITEC